MYRPTRATLAMGLCLVGVAGLVGRSFGQQGDARVQKTATPAPAAEAAAARVAPKPLLIGSIDVEKVLKDYDKVKVTSENVRAEMLARHNSLMAIAAEAKQEDEKFQRMAPNSPDAKKCEDKLTQLKAQFEASRENAQREFTQKEAEMMAVIYNEVSAMTKGVALQRGMTFVVKYSDAMANGSEPNSVMATMSRTILFADPGVDITRDVTYYLNQRYRESGGPAPKNTTNAMQNNGSIAPKAATPAGRPAAPAPK
jgi:Skp family chaperone for outer membrane proteins